VSGIIEIEKGATNSFAVERPVDGMRSSRSEEGYDEEGEQVGAFVEP